MHWTFVKWQVMLNCDTVVSKHNWHLTPFKSKYIFQNSKELYLPILENIILVTNTKLYYYTVLLIGHKSGNKYVL